MQSKEQRLARLAAVLRADDAVMKPDVWYADKNDGIERFAERLLEAADREQPIWPTEEMLDAMGDELYGAGHTPTDALRGECRQAFLAAHRADPRRKVVLAAILLRAAQRKGGTGLEFRALMDAIDEAGL